MNIHCIRDDPPEWLGEALEQFEREFVYPLGSDQTFRISHGSKYLPFFQAMGKCTLLVAEAGGKVLGTVVRVERLLERRGAEILQRNVHYLADVKVSLAARGSRVLARLMLEVKRQIELTESFACYCVVMNGTKMLPPDYTGRIGIPTFNKIADIMVLRVSSMIGSTTCEGYSPGKSVPQANCFLKGRTRELRSLIQPVPIQGDAWIEDTRRGKQLFLSTGEELLSAHLSSFRFENANDAASTIQCALEKVNELGFPALFTAVPRSRYAELKASLRGVSIQEAPASVYAYDLPDGDDWWIDTSEI